MARNILRNKVGMVIALSLILALSSTNAFAWGGHRGHGGRYYWHGDRYYRHGWFGFDVVASALTMGAVVASLPYGHTTVVVGGAPYYYYDGIYYRSGPAGYVVVPAPEVSPVVVAAPTVVAAAPATVVAAPVAPSQSESQDGGSVVVINVPNASGGYTPVRLVKHNDGYIGPQGEFYSGNPMVDQLKALYGK